MFIIFPKDFIEGGISFVIGLKKDSPPNIIVLLNFSYGLWSSQA